MGNEIVGNTATREVSLPIVMAADAGYLIPTLVAVDSIYASATKVDSVDLYLIVNRDDAPLFSGPLKQIADHYGARDPQLLLVENEYSEAPICISHITTATYYRLELPSLLPGVDRCLYLDGDVIARGDLAEILDSLGGGDLIAGVKAAGYYWPEAVKERNRVRLGLAEFESYLNAGVLAMNLRLMRELDCASEFARLLEEGYESQDQDILNKACVGRVSSLPPKYNVMTKYHPESEASYKEVSCLEACFTEGEWLEAQENPVVIHYADRIKPWNDAGVDFAKVWWESAVRASGHVDALRVALPLLRRGAESLANCRDEAEAKSAECKELECSLAIEQKGKAFLEGELDNARAGLAQEKEEVEKLSRLHAESERRLASATKKLDEASATMRQLYASNSWKIGRAVTAPARKIKKISSRLRES